MSKLPRFCNKESSTFPCIIAQDSTIIDPKEFYNRGISFAPSGTNIEFKVSLIKVPITPGAKNSIDLLNSLLECSNDKVFRT